MCEIFDMMEETHNGLTSKDVWGDSRAGTRGMIVADSGEKCPIFKDIVPYKSATLVFDEAIFNDVKYWLDSEQGGNNISKKKKLPDGKIAVRSDYHCW